MGTVIPVHNKDSNIRRQPGDKPALRRLKFKEWMRVGLDPDTMRSGESPPSHVQAQMEAVFGERAKNLKLRVHPLFRRWTLWERYRDPTSGRELAWAPVSVFFEPATEDLPADLQGRGLDHLRGQVGDFRVPTKRDFEIIEGFDVRKYGANAVEATAAEAEEGAVDELVRDFERETEAFHLDHFWLAMRDAQEHYSQPWSTRNVAVKQNAAKWKITKKDGYTVRERVWGEEGDKNAVDKAISDPETQDHLYSQELQDLLDRVENRNVGRGRIVYHPDGTKTLEYLDDEEKRNVVDDQPRRKRQAERTM